MNNKKEQTYQLPYFLPSSLLDILVLYPQCVFLFLLFIYKKMKLKFWISPYFDWIIIRKYCYIGMWCGRIWIWGKLAGLVILSLLDWMNDGVFAGGLGALSRTRPWSKLAMVGGKPHPHYIFFSNFLNKLDNAWLFK